MNTSLHASNQVLSFQTFVLTRTAPLQLLSHAGNKGEHNRALQVYHGTETPPCLQRALVQEPPDRRGFHFKEFAHRSQTAPCALLTLTNSPSRTVIGPQELRPRHWRNLSFRASTSTVDHLTRGMYVTVTTRIHFDWTTSFLSDIPIVGGSFGRVN